MAAHSTADIASRIKTIIRRDLKLGSDISITDDMPFFGTDADVDSLDILLLLSSIEKEFGVKVPSEKVGREIFENVGTLIRFIQGQLGAAEDAGAVAAPPASGAAGNPLDRLPHRDPFRFITKIIAVKQGESVEAAWSLTGSEPFFAGHFPGRPIVPGVLIVEALAQASGLALDGKANEGMLAHADIRFESPAAPPGDIVLQSKLTRTMGSLTQFDVEASAKGKIVARGTLALSCSSAV